MHRYFQIRWISAFAGVIILASSHITLAKTKSANTAQSRADYVANVQEDSAPGSISASGSLWSPDAMLDGMTSDYKARRVGDTVTIQVIQQTTAQSAGDLNAQRQFQTTSAITGLPGRIKTGGVNPLLNANSSTQTKGQGSASNTSKLLTSVTGRVISVLPSGNLVVEAQREILMNNQHETMLIRGVLRPGDINTLNMVPSTALANLEIELKGKGAISDATRRPNVITRTVLWFLGF